MLLRTRRLVRAVRVLSTWFEVDLGEAGCGSVWSGRLAWIFGFCNIDMSL